MRTLLSGIAVSALLAAPALAADLPARMPVKAPVAEAAFNWTGFYLGGHGGYGRGNAGWINTASNAATGEWPDLLPGDTASHKIRGWVGGGQVGYNVQSGAMVYGLELSGSGTGIKGSSVSGPGPFSAQDDAFSTKLRALFMASARLGYAAGNLLFYVKGGYAGANIRTSAVDVVGVVGSGADTNWHSGWNVGAGAEFAVWESTSLAIQYDFVRLGTESSVLSGGAGVYVWDVRARDNHILTGRLNWRFGAGPVSARY